MKVLLFMSVFWTLYGIAGLFAVPSIVFTYKWEKKYEKLLKDGTK